MSDTAALKALAKASLTIGHATVSLGYEGNKILTLLSELEALQKKMAEAEDKIEEFKDAAIRPRLDRFGSENGWYDCKLCGAELSPSDHYPQIYKHRNDCPLCVQGD